MWRPMWRTFGLLQRSDERMKESINHHPSKSLSIGDYRLRHRPSSNRIGAHIVYGVLTYRYSQTHGWEDLSLHCYLPSTGRVSLACIPSPNVDPLLYLAWKCCYHNIFYLDTLDRLLQRNVRKPTSSKTKFDFWR
jgi:hypothetical protein